MDVELVHKHRIVVIIYDFNSFLAKFGSPFLTCNLNCEWLFWSLSPCAWSLQMLHWNVLDQRRVLLLFCVFPSYLLLTVQVTRSFVWSEFLVEAENLAWAFGWCFVGGIALLSGTRLERFIFLALKLDLGISLSRVRLASLQWIYWGRCFSFFLTWIFRILYSSLLARPYLRCCLALTRGSLHNWIGLVELRVIVHQRRAGVNIQSVFSIEVAKESIYGKFLGRGRRRLILSGVWRFLFLDRLSWTIPIVALLFRTSSIV